MLPDSSYFLCFIILGYNWIKSHNKSINMRVIKQLLWVFFLVRKFILFSAAMPKALALPPPFDSLTVKLFFTVYRALDGMRLSA